MQVAGFKFQVISIRYIRETSCPIGFVVHISNLKLACR